MQPVNIIGISTMAMGVLIALVCVPLLLDQVPMNRYYGFRYKRSMESDALWYAINHYGARQMIRWSLVLAAMGGFILFGPDRLVFPVLPAAPWAPLILLIPTLQSYWYAKSLPLDGPNE